MEDSRRDKVSASIRDYGWHYCRVGGGPSPVWTYTIGLRQTHQSAELVMAGAGYFSRREIERIFREIVAALPANPPTAGEVRTVGGAGPVHFRAVHPSWIRELMPDAIEYGEDGTAEAVEALQIVPSLDRKTIDTPDLSVEFGSRAELPWRWLHDEWPYQLPETTLILTDVDALHGSRVVKVWRNQDDAKGPAWEMFTSDVHAIPAEVGRVVPLGTLLAVDSSLSDVLGLAPGAMAERRSGSSPWDLRDAGRGAQKPSGATRRSGSRGSPGRRPNVPGSRKRAR